MTNTHADTFRNNPWILNLILICDKRRTDRERDSTLIPGFVEHMHERAHFLKPSHTLSHPNTRRMCVWVCVCVCARPCVLVLWLKRRSAAERVRLWAGYLGQTSARRLGKHQSEWLCSAVGSPATARPLQDRLHQPTHDKVST